jgi:hypothetical protein
MRSAYETVDELNFIAMNDFQRAFWRQRASEQGVGTLEHPLQPS